MTDLVALLLGYLLIALAHTLFAMRTTRSHLFRVISLGYLVVTIGYALYFYNQLLSRPKPITQEYFSQAKDAVVLGTRAKGDGTVYLWLQLPDREYPSYYVMTWNGQAAHELEIAQREAAQQDGLVLMHHPFRRNAQRGLRAQEIDPVFYASPPPRPPEKWGESHADAVVQVPGDARRGK